MISALFASLKRLLLKIGHSAGRWNASRADSIDGPRISIRVPITTTFQTKRPMHQINLARFQYTDKTTIGRLSDDSGKLICYTLEDTARKKKVPGETAIPSGRYEIRLADYKGRGLHPLLMRVPYFEGIFIHPGNFALDTRGCILVGVDYGKDRLFQSVVAFEDLLMPRIKKMLEAGDLWISITGGRPAEEWEEHKHARLD